MSFSTLNGERGTWNLLIIFPACYTLLALIGIEGAKLDLLIGEFHLNCVLNRDDKKRIKK
jgi:hypothetical protein